MRQSKHQNAPELFEQLGFRESLFVRAYISEPEPKMAALAAGWTHGEAPIIARQMMSNPLVRASIRAEQERLQRKFSVSAERVINELARIAFSNMDDFMTVDHDGTRRINLNKASSQEMSAVSSIQLEEILIPQKDEDGPPAAILRKLKIKLWDKHRALTALGSHLGLKFQGDGTPVDDQDTVFEFTMRLGDVGTDRDEEQARLAPLEGVPYVDSEDDTVKGTI